MRTVAEVPWKLLAGDLAFPEGPAFAPDGSLWCVELKGGRLARLCEGRLERFDVGGAPNGIAIDGEGRVWFCDAEQRSIRRWTEGRCETICSHIDAERLYKPNDLCFDGSGNLLFTCPGDSRTEPLGYVCCLRPDASLHKIATSLYFPNGLALVDGGRTLIVAETYRHRLWRGGWDAETCTWSSPTPWAAAGGPIGPDGMAFHPSGLLYVAVYGQQAVKVFDPGGNLVDALPTPGLNPTNVAFDPSGRLGLIVTEAEQGCLWSLQDV
ncbi:MAG: SMP-30/gluconolactonase/LRE family protein [Candidatus Solibacter sp.]|jgi:gluconolactonase